jgi:hypothetical protein
VSGGAARVGVVLAAVAALAAAMGLPRPAFAHGRSTSTSKWTIESGEVASARVLLKVQLSDVHRVLPELAGMTPSAIASRAGARRVLQEYLTRNVTLSVDGSPCAVDGPVLMKAAPEPTHLVHTWRVGCDASGTPELWIRPFVETLSGHMHLARVALPDGAIRERVFGLDRERRTLAAPADRPGQVGASGFSEYLVLGVEHILTCWDHLVFLLALLLVGVTAWEVATIVTGFTVAHSLTLALGVLGLVQPVAAAIEALIGLSIVVVALENFAWTAGVATRRAVYGVVVAGVGGAALASLLGWVGVPALALVGIALFTLGYLGLLGRVARPGRLRWFVAFVFGLIHGFGFAGLLVEIGLPTDRLAPALLGFNLGVEFGQLALVALAWPVLRLALGAQPTARALRIQLGSAAVMVVGIYWFLTRAMG